MSTPSKNKNPANTGIAISKKLVLINSSAALLGRLIDVGVLFWVQRYLIHNIGVEEYSLLPLVGSLVSMIPLFTTIFTSGISRYLVEAYAEGNSLKVKKIISSVWPVIMVVSFLLMAIVCYFAFNIEKLLNIPPQKETLSRIMLLMAFGNLLFEINAAPFMAGFNIKQKFYLRNVLDSSFVFFRVIVLIFLLTYFGASVFWVVLANFISNLLKTIIKVFVSCRLVKSLRFDRHLFEFNTAKSVFSFGLWSLLSRIGKKIKLSVDPILLNLFATPMDISVFYIGSLFSDHFDTLVLLLIGPLQPPLIAMYTKKEFKRLEALFYRLNKYLMWSCLFIITPALFFREQIIEFYVGDKFADASIIMGFLFLPSFFQLSLKLIWILAPAMGQIKYLSIMTFLTQVLNLIMTIIFLKYFHLGATGSALATCIIGLVVMPIFLLFHSLHLINGRISRWGIQTFLPGIIPSCVCFLSLFCLGLYEAQDSLLSVIISGAVGGMFYFFTVLLCTTPTDRSEIFQMIKSVAKK